MKLFSSPLCATIILFLDSYSRQNMLSKSNANVPQSYSHEPSPSAAETSRYTAEGLNHHTQPYTDVSPGSLDSSRLVVTTNFSHTFRFEMIEHIMIIISPTDEMVGPRIHGQHLAFTKT